MITHDEVSITSHYRTVPTVARFIRTLRLGSSTDIKIKMTLTSKYPDVRIPDNVSWPEFVFQNFDKYGEDIALVSTQNLRAVLSVFNRISCEMASFVRFFICSCVNILDKFRE